MSGYSPISDILSFGKSKKYSDKIMSNIINIDLTEDKKGIIFTTQDGVSFTVFFPYTLHEHSNLDILERININDSGELTFDGKSIKGDIFVKDDYYNKAEIDNRITSITKGMSWKENVSTKTELENLENNSKGDARIVDEESNIYVFNGESWDKVGSSINIPNATSENDGLLSKEDYNKLNNLDNIYVQKDNNKTLSSNDYTNIDKNKVNNIITDGEGNKFLSDSGNYIEIGETHNHTNLDNLNKIGQDSEGNLTYNGEPTLTNKDFEVFKTNTIGTSELSTEDKTLKGAINELFTSVSNGKNLLETAITDKGGVVSKSGDIATFNELKNGIGNIKTGINIFSQIDKPKSNNGIWIKNNKMYENIDFFDSSEDTTFENEKMTDLSFYFYTTNRTLTIKKEIHILTKYTDSNDNIKSIIYKYNTENNVYEVVSSISDSTSCYFYESCAISVGNYIYLFNLKSIQNPSDCSSYKYNIETNTYTGINNSISISNGSFAIAINNNEIYIFSGTKIYLYNISTNSYETLENCPYDCRYGAGILINNDIYIFGGVSNYAAYKYDIINKQFTKLKDIPSRFSRNNIIKIDNYIYLFGCSTDYKELDGELNAYEENKKSYRYDINSDTYERISDVPYDILAKRVELVGNDIYILGSNTTTNKRYNIKLTKKELKPNSILFMNTQIIPRYNVKLYNNIDYEKMNNFSFYKMITTNENAEIETVEKYIYNDSKWIKI